MTFHLDASNPMFPTTLWLMIHINMNDDNNNDMLPKGAQIKGENFNSQENLIQLSGVGDTFRECSEIAQKDNTEKKEYRLHQML